MNASMACAGSAFQWVLQASWQAAVLAVLVLIAQVSFRKRLSPAWRYGLWLLVVGRLLMPVSPESALSIFNLTRLTARRETKSDLPPAQRSNLDAPETTISRELIPGSVADAQDSVPQSVQTARSIESQADSARRAGLVSAAPQNRKQPINWSTFVCWIWFAGVGLLTARLVWANVRFRSCLNRHVAVSDADVLRLAQECAAILGVRKRLTIIETKEVESPAVWGLWRKRLLLPRGILDRFTPAELRHIFLHEFAHIKRRDLEINCLVGILQILHWFNPVLWFAFARMRADRELATDALALARSRGSEAVSYGETILKVLEGLAGKSHQPGLVGIAESKARLKERMLAIANRDRMRPWRWAAVLIVAVLAGVGLTSARQNRESNAGSHADSGQKSFAIRALDYDTGKPLSGVTVSFSLDYYDGSSKKLEAISGRDGRATIRFSPTDLKRLAYQTSKTNYMALGAEWLDQQLSSLPSEFEIKVPEGRVIGGKVNDEGGKPVAGVEVSWDEGSGLFLNGAEGYDSTVARTWQISSERLAKTDVNGEWRAKCMWPAVKWASIKFRHPDFADFNCSTGDNDGMGAEGGGKVIDFDDLAHFRLIVQMTKGVTVKGRVLNEAGQPLSGIPVNYFELLLKPRSISHQLLGKRSTTSDSAGTFQFQHAREKHIYLLVQTAGYGPSAAESDAKQSMPEIELRLTKGQRFSCRIVDSHDEPISDARAKVKDFGTWRGLEWEVTSDDQGRIEWPDAPAEKFQLVVEKIGFITQQKIVQATGENETKIRLDPTLKIAGKVLDAESKEPVKRFRFEWMGRNDPKEFEQGYQISTIPGSNGVYSVDVGRLHVPEWRTGYARQCIFRVQADGYTPSVSRVFDAMKGDVGDVTYDVELKRARQITGTILDSAGHPVAGAQVALEVPSSKLRLSGQTTFASPVSPAVRLSDGKGKFRLDDNPTGQGLVAVLEKGFAELGTNELSTNLTVRLQAWGKLKGSVWDYDKPATNQQVWVNDANRSGLQSLSIYFSTNTDARGEFALDMPPGKYTVFRMIPMGNLPRSGPQEMVQVESGETATVKVGGNGRAVVGSFKITNPYVEVNWTSDVNHPYVRFVFPKPPENLKTRQEIEAWQKQLKVQLAYENKRNYPLQLTAKGAFRMDEVLPGKYEIQLQLYDPRDPQAYANDKVICNVLKPFEVPESNDHSPLDLGAMEILLKPDIMPGMEAPDFEATDMAGNKMKLSDFRGKYVLLDFWATWCGPGIGEPPYLRQVYYRFKDRKDFVMVSLNFDKTINAPREFMKTNSLPWVQGYLGDWSQTKVPEQYGIQGIPATFLISPEGKIIESELAGSWLVNRLGKFLQ